MSRYGRVLVAVDESFVTHIYSDASGTWCGLEVDEGRTSTGAAVDGAEEDGRIYCSACLEMEREFTRWHV